MEERYLGLEISDAGFSVAVMDPQTKKVQSVTETERDSLFPGLLSYDLETDIWNVGYEAQALEGRENCIILHRLVSLFKSCQNLLINEVTYTADDLLGYYIKNIIEWVYDHFEEVMISKLAICMDNLSLAEGERINSVLIKIGLKPSNVHILNRQECFMHYQMSLNKELWTNMSYLLDYDKNGLTVYQLFLKKSGVKNLVIVKQETIENAPSVFLLHQNKENDEAADQFFVNLVNRLLKGQIVNCFLLTGEGFRNLDWARNMLQTAAAQKSRKIFQINAVYCMGAACAAFHLTDESTRFPYEILCDDHISAEISLISEQKEGRVQLVLIPCGTAYRDARAHLNLLLEDEQKLTLYVKNAGAYEDYQIHIGLEPFMEKKQDRIRISLNLAFINDHEMMVKIKDLGFGEFYPATGKMITQKFTI